MKKILKSILSSAGIEIRRIRKKSTVVQPVFNDHMLGGLIRFKALNIPVNTVIDVGAAAGTWSLEALRLWPDCFYLLFEPLMERKVELERLAAKHPNFYFVPFAAGSGESQVRFRVTGDLDGSGIAMEKHTGKDTRSVNVASIEVEVDRLNLQGPYIIKLDTHGFEVPILIGCSNIMKEVALWIVECYGFRIADNSLLFWEMCQKMDELGFRLFDIVDTMHRPHDNAFWQCDAFFIRKDNLLFRDNTYH